MYNVCISGLDQRQTCLKPLLLNLWKIFEKKRSGQGPMNAFVRQFITYCCVFSVHKNSLSPHLLSRFDQYPKLVFLVFYRDPITHDWSRKATLRTERQTLLRNVSASLVNTSG